MSRESERDRRHRVHGKAQVQELWGVGIPKSICSSLGMLLSEVTPSHSFPSSGFFLILPEDPERRQSPLPPFPAPHRDNQARKNKLKSPGAWQGLGKFGLTEQQHLTKLTSSITGAQSFRYQAFDYTNMGGWGKARLGASYPCLQIRPSHTIRLP